MHARQAVREAVAALLSVTPTNWRGVFETRIVPQRDVYPYLLVYAESESSTPITIHPTQILARDIEISIIGHLRIADAETLEDKMDAIAAEVETTLTQATLNAELNGKLRSLTLTSTVPNIVADDERAYAEIVLLYRAQIMTTEGAPETLT